MKKLWKFLSVFSPSPTPTPNLLDGPYTYRPSKIMFGIVRYEILYDGEPKLPLKYCDEILTLQEAITICNELNDFERNL